MKTVGKIFAQAKQDTTPAKADAQQTQAKQDTTPAKAKRAQKGE